MAEERDIVGISVPFAAGIAAGEFLCARLDSPFHHIACPVLLAIAAGLFILAATIRPSHLSDRPSGAALFPAVFLITGIFCSLNHSIASGIPEHPDAPSTGIAERTVTHLKTAIDDIPYPSETTAPLVKALLTGDRGDLSKEITGIFRDSGAAHILALSGLHLGVLYIILARLASPLGNSLTARKLRYSLIISAALFYSVMTGASPSIIRAFLFITINETCKILGRKRSPVRVLLGALTIQLALKPDVITSVGFQLSYLAMAGIYLLYPVLERIYPSAGGSGLSGFDPFRKIWNTAMLSVSCQVFTGPLAWHYFHTFPKYFILTNLVALPLTSATMTLSVATIALSFFGICPEPLVLLNDYVIQSLVYCLKIIAGLDEPWLT